MMKGKHKSCSSNTLWQHQTLHQSFNPYYQVLTHHEPQCLCETNRQQKQPTPSEASG
jgi:hypothetical protein